MGSLSEPQRLDSPAWVAAALELLSEQGIDRVRVEPLAKRLGVTKGSFYWHFKDRDALLEAMLQDWRRRATVQIIERLENKAEPAQARLRQLLRLPFRGRRSAHGAEIELSIRLWGRVDSRARSALEEVDSLRLRYLAQLLTECGVDEEESAARAILAYSYLRVGASLAKADQEDLLARCEDALLRP